MNLITISSLLIFGGIGALAKEILDDNCLKLPKINDGKIFLGFIGSIIIGAVVGFLVDHSPLMAFFAGYTGFSAAGALIQNKAKAFTENMGRESEKNRNSLNSETKKEEEKNLSIPDIIKKISAEYKVDYELALAVAKCESGLNPKARNVNEGGSRDRGLYQINDYWHKEVSDEQADDPVFATEFFCKAVRDGNISWWNASKKCWQKAIDNK